MRELDKYINGPSGTRLPPERQLAEELGLSRNEVRKALARYELEGRIVRHVGRGTFVRGYKGAAGADIAALQRISRPRDAMEARFAIEPEVCRVAALNATLGQLEELQSLAERIRRARTWSEYKVIDGEFHQAIAKASGNELLCAIHRIVDEVRKSIVWPKLETAGKGPPADYSSFAEHQAIVDAITRRDAAGAAEAMRKHLQTTNNRMLD